MNSGTAVPEGMEHIVLKESEYQKRVAKGTIPNSITEAWQKIWDSDIPRAYKIDFEIYDQRSKDWANGEVDIYVSILN